ncbi:MAG: hypothetical protein WC882_05955 [Candidatus Gracilibacteria bacterium]
MKVALITGSETFGDYIVNPTKWLALKMRGKVVCGHKIHSVVFPSIVRYPEDAETPGEMLVKKAIEIKADVILSFGLASGVKGFCIERTGTNWIENKAYCAPHEHKRLIDPSRPAHEKVQIDLNRWDFLKIKQELKKNKIPCESRISDNACNYSCNAWLYRIVCALKKHELNIPYLFTHVACTKKSIELIPRFSPKKTIIKESDLVKALEIFLGAYH